MDVVPLERKYEALTRAVIVLKSVGVIVVPTDTVYGWCADAQNPKAIEQVFIIKARSRREPLPVLVRDFAMLDDVAYVADGRTRAFLEAVWPGGVSAVLPSRGWMPLSLRANRLSICVRIPDTSFATELLKSFGKPLVGTSANLAGRPACASAQEVAKQFSHVPTRPDYMIDAGALPGVPSTVVDVTVWPPAILREGAVPADMILAYAQQAEKKHAA